MTWFRAIAAHRKQMKACRKLAQHKAENLRDLESSNWKARSSAAKRGWARRRGG